MSQPFVNVVLVTACFGLMQSAPLSPSRSARSGLKSHSKRDSSILVDFGLGPNVWINLSELSMEMTREAARVALDAFGNTFREYNDVAEEIANHFDDRHGPDSWTCIVGSNYGFSVTYETGRYIDFKLGDVKILLYVPYMADKKRKK